MSTETVPSSLSSSPSLTFSHLSLFLHPSPPPISSFFPCLNSASPCTVFNFWNLSSSGRRDGVLHGSRETFCIQDSITSQWKRAAQILAMTLTGQGLMTDLLVPEQGDWFPVRHRRGSFSLSEEEGKENCFMQMNRSFCHLISGLYLDWWNESMLGFISL